MTTYVLGAAASVHAGYPLCSELWPKMSVWVVETQSPDSDFRKAIDEIATLSGPVADIESVLTDVDLGQGAFQALEKGVRWKTMGTIRRCVRAYFKSIHDSHRGAALYEAFARTVNKGDVVLTFNYDTALENELIRAGKFCVREGYGCPRFCARRLSKTPSRCEHGMCRRPESALRADSCAASRCTLRSC